MDWWLKDKGFQNLVKLEWGNYHPQGWGGLVLKQKIKFIKQRIRQWSISQGHISTRKVLNLKRELNALEDGLTNRILSQDEVKIKKSLQEQLWNVAYAVESMLRQKARVNHARNLGTTLECTKDSRVHSMLEIYQNMHTKFR